MSNKMLRKAMKKLEAMPEAQLKKLIALQLAESDLHEALLEHGNEGYCVLDSRRRIVYANSHFGILLPSNRQFLGRSEGHELCQIITDATVLEYLEGITIEAEEGEKEFFFQQGSEVRIINVINSRLNTDEGEYLTFIVQDVTEERRSEARLRRSESLASMTTMAAGIAHEIKNPLAAMQIHLQLLRKAFSRKGSLTLDEAERYISVLDEEIEHLNGIAVDFLFAVRPMNVQLKKQRLESVLQSLDDFVRPELEEHGIVFTLDVAHFLPQLMLDEKYLRQALLNMVKNAMNAMEKGGRLTIRAYSDGDYVKIGVSDTGCGIDREHLAKIFEPYFTTKASGTGLGLTLVYKIVKEHGGEISVESTVGKGTDFTISLPVPKDERAVLEEKTNG